MVNSGLAYKMNNFQCHIFCNLELGLQQSGTKLKLSKWFNFINYQVCHMKIQLRLDLPEPNVRRLVEPKSVKHLEYCKDN